MTWKDVKISEDHGVIRVSTPGNGTDYVDVNTALRMYLGKARGWDTWTVTRTKKDGTTYADSQRCPMTTYADVVQLSVFWDQQIDAAGQTLTAIDYKRQTWRDARNDLVALAKDAKPRGVYPKNREWWKAAESAAIAVDLEREDGAKQTSAVDAVVGFFSDAVPDAIGDALKWAGSKAEEGAKEAAEVAGGAAKGFLDALGLKEILVGAGVIVGAAIILPAMSKREGARPKGGAS